MREFVVKLRVRFPDNAKYPGNGWVLSESEVAALLESGVRDAAYALGGELVEHQVHEAKQPPEGGTLTSHALGWQLLAGPDLPVQLKVHTTVDGDFDAFWGPCYKADAANDPGQVWLYADTDTDDEEE